MTLIDPDTAPTEAEVAAYSEYLRRTRGNRKARKRVPRVDVLVAKGAHEVATPLVCQLDDRTLAKETLPVDDPYLLAELDEPNDAFRELDFAPTPALPSTPITKPLRKEIRVTILMQRYERGESLFHPDDVGAKRRKPVVCYVAGRPEGE